MNTTINNSYACLDILEEESFATEGFKIIDPTLGEHRVRLMENPNYREGSRDPARKYPFKIEMYAARVNQSRPVKDRMGNVKSYDCWDEKLPPDAVIRPKALKLYFIEKNGGMYEAYLANYIMKNGDMIWNKFVEDMAGQLQRGGMNITNTLHEMMKQTFSVWLYRNPKYEGYQVCYTEKDYLYWASQEALRKEADEEYKKSKAAKKAAKK